MKISFCTQCGSPTTLKIPPGDQLPRYCCTNCHHIHYQNPNIVAGCVIYQGDQVLLCKRAIEPRLGFWTLPAGFMENDETTRQAAAREAFEETGAKVTTRELFAITNAPQVNHVNIFYLAELGDNTFHPTEESSEVKLFREEDIPFEDIAFITVKTVLKKFFKDHRNGNYQLHEIDF